MVRFRPLVMAAWVATATAQAQISLSSAVDLALRNEPRVKMAQADVAKAHAGVSEAKHAYVPVVGAGGGYGHSTGVPLGLPTVFSISAESLGFNFSQIDNVRAAESAELAALLTLNEVSGQVSEDAATTYLNLDSVQRRLGVMQTETASAKRLEEILQERVDAGFDSQLELLKARRTAAQVRLAKLSVEQESADLSRHLANLIGVAGMTVATRSESIPPLPSITSLDDVAKTSPGIEAAFRIAESKDKLAVSARHKVYSPQVYFTANYTRIDTSTTQSKFLEYYPNFIGKGQQAASIAVQVQLPLFNLGELDRSRQVAADAVRARWEAGKRAATVFRGARQGAALFAGVGGQERVGKA